jgi:hypothetical protein
LSSKEITMNKVCGLLAMIMIFASCDDGDLIFEEINFDDVEAARCAGGNVIYKINDTEVLLLKIGENENAADFVNAFPLEPTPPGEPVSIPINNSTVQVVYQLFNGAVSSANLCAIVRPATPVVVEDWEATAGRVEITTTTNTVANDNPGFEGGERIAGYQHNIIFRDITFQKADGTTQVYDEFPFGIYETTVDDLDFSFGGVALLACPTTNILFKHSGREGITLDIDSTLLDTSQLNTPKTGTITDTTNILTYLLFPPNNTLNESYFCGVPPVQPLETWTGVEGVANVSGIVEVITTTASNGFLHTIRLKNVSFQRGRSIFKLADDYLLGEIITAN